MWNAVKKTNGFLSENVVFMFYGQELEDGRGVLNLNARLGLGSSAAHLTQGFLLCEQLGVTLAGVSV